MRVLQQLGQPKWLIPLLFVILVNFVLFWPPHIGLANNGDYDRLMALVGLHYPSHDVYYYERYDHYFVSAFRMGWFGHSFYPSSALVTIVVAYLINAILHFGVFSTAVQAYVYIALLAYGLHVLLRSLHALFSIYVAYGVGILSLFMLTEIGYAAYLPTLYSEPASLVFYLLLIAFLFALIVDEKNRFYRRAIWIVTGLFLTSKVQNTVLLPFALLTLYGVTQRVIGLYSFRKFLKYSAILSLVVIAVYFANPPSFVTQNTYDSFFTGLMMVATPTDHLLAWFHLNGRLAVLRAGSYFSYYGMKWQSRVVADQFYQKVSLFKIVLFYLVHPHDWIKALQISQNAAFTLRPSYLGNFTFQAHRGAGTLSQRFDFWRIVRAKLPHSLYFWLLEMVGIVGVTIAILRFRRNKKAVLMAWVVLMMACFALAQWSIPFMGEGENELVKHLFLYDVLFDALLVTVVGYGIWQIERLVRAWMRLRHYSNG